MMFKCREQDDLVRRLDDDTMMFKCIDRMI